MTILSQQIVGISHMVAMIVSEDQALHPAHRHPVLLQDIADMIGTYTGIDHYPTILIADIATIAARAGSKRDVMQTGGDIDIREATIIIGKLDIRDNIFGRSIHLIQSSRALEHVL